MRSTYGWSRDAVARGARRSALAQPRTIGSTRLSFVRSTTHHWLEHHRDIVRRSDGFRGKHHLWTGYSLDVRRARPFLRWCQRALRNEGVAPYLPTVHLVAAARPNPAARLPLEPTPDGSALVVSVGLFCDVPEQDGDGVERVRALHRDALEQCLALGGRPYLCGWVEMDAGTARAAYGPSFEHLAELRAQLDPNRLFSAAALVGL
jgi:FAD/FMN-containing dehydrogenase